MITLAPWPRGSRHGMSKLDERQVRAIRRAAARGVGQYELAERYGVSQSTISRIVARAIWIHV